MKDLYNLQRFVEAQDPVFDDVCAQLRAGRKTSHWMWFIFPQIQGLGSSGTARVFAISSLDEARAYLQHPVLGDRIRKCTSLVLLARGVSAEQIFGYPDYLKFRSSMTLFAQAAADNQVFLEALETFFPGKPDPLTLKILSEA